MTERTCSVEGCERPLVARGYCKAHYIRFWRRGSTELALRRQPALQRFHAGILVTDSGCWEWQGATTRGYGRFMAAGMNVLVHRFAYETFVGPIPEGMHLDHLCRNRSCANPAHLEPVDAAENNRRSAPYREVTITCRNGHDRATFGYVRNDGRTECRRCTREQAARYDREHREQRRQAAKSQRERRGPLEAGE